MFLDTTIGLVAVARVLVRRGYLLYRYFVCGIIVDGMGVAAFHFIQGFWCRYLLDPKLAALKRHIINMEWIGVASIQAALEVAQDPNLSGVSRARHMLSDD